MIALSPSPAMTHLRRSPLGRISPRRRTLALTALVVALAVGRGSVVVAAPADAGSAGADAGAEAGQRTSLDGGAGPDAGVTGRTAIVETSATGPITAVPSPAGSSSAPTETATAATTATAASPAPAAATLGATGGASATADAAASAANGAAASAASSASEGGTSNATSSAEPGTAEAEIAATPPSRGFLADALGLPGEWQSRGELALEGRLFRDDSLPNTKDKGLGLLGRIELQHSHGPMTEKARVYGRLDRYDERRQVLLWEEAYLQLGFERLRLRAGLDVVNWTATEAFHPADVINARNLDSDLENLEKIGEPMLSLQVRPFDGTTITLIAMPYRSEPLFASPNSRLGFAGGADLRGARRMIDRDGRFSDDNWGPQGAIAIRQTIGPADITVHALEQMDRAQPLIRFDPSTFRPLLVFQTVQQLGGTYQHAVDALLIKLEGAYRRFRPPKDLLPGAPLPGSVFTEKMPDHGQLAAGLEYGITHDGGPDSTFLLEGQTVIGAKGELERAALSVFQRDVLVGYRLALNDESNKELLIGVIFDTERAGETLFNVSYAQRLGETWTVRAGLRIFQAEATAPGPLGLLRDADHVRLTLTRHF